jgi:hypothetical protein
MHPEIPAMMADLQRRFSMGIHYRNSELVKVDTPEHPFWYVNIFIGLAHETMKMQYHIRRAYAEGEINYCAWAARNLLELRVWTLYATASRENAWRFHQDQYADGLSLVRILERSADKLPRAMDAQFLKEAAATIRPLMEEHAAKADVTDKLPYLNAKQMSKQFDLEGEFELYNVMFSKVLHSTGLSVLVAQNEDSKVNTMDSMFRYAATCALAILDALNVRLKAENLPVFE